MTSQTAFPDNTQLYVRVLRSPEWRSLETSGLQLYDKRQCVDEIPT